MSPNANASSTRPVSRIGMPATTSAITLIATAGQRAPAREPSSHPRISRYESPVTVQKITRLVIALASAETASPASTVRVGVIVPSALASSSVAASAATRSDERRERQHDRDAEQQHRDRAERRAGREPEQVGVGERIARDRLHHRAADREPRADRGRRDHARQPQLPHDAVAQHGQRTVAEAEVAADRRPDLAERDVGRPDRHRDDERQHERDRECDAPEPREPCSGGARLMGRRGESSW